MENLFGLIDIQLNSIEKLSGSIFNVGGGWEVSVSLKELTQLSQQYTGNTIPISSVMENRPADIRIYLTDNSKVIKATGWKPEITVENIIEEIVFWIKNNEKQLEGVLK